MLNTIIEIALDDLRKWFIETVVIEKMTFFICLSETYECVEVSCNPIIDIIRVLRKNILQKVIGSLKTSIPKITVPTAPIPAHTA